MKKVLSKGFTLIELIIVIAIIAILAVGVIAALNPVEQVNRGTDTTRRTLATELSNAFNRFFAVQQYSAACPAGTAAGASTCAYIDSLTNASPGVNVNTLTTVNTNMAAVGEARTATSFSGAAQAPNLSVVMTVASNAAGSGTATAIICWQPLSIQQKSRGVTATLDRSGTVYVDRAGTVGTAAQCPPNSTNTCFQCVFQ